MDVYKGQVASSGLLPDCEKFAEVRFQLSSIYPRCLACQLLGVGAAVPPVQLSPLLLQDDRQPRRGG